MEKQKVIIADRSADVIFLSEYIHEAINFRSLPDRKFESPDFQRLYNNLKSIVEKAFD